MAAMNEGGHGLLDEWEAALQAERNADDALADAFDTYCLGGQSVDAVVEAMHDRLTAADRARQVLERRRRHGAAQLMKRADGQILEDAFADRARLGSP